MAWTPELVKELEKLWKKGLTTMEIGNQLGLSKNAVVGKAHRLGLESRPSPIKYENVKRVASKAIHKKETTSAVGILYRAFFIASLTEKCSLLVACNTADWNFGIEDKLVGNADFARRINNIRKHF